MSASDNGAGGGGAAAGGAAGAGGSKSRAEGKSAKRERKKQDDPEGLKQYERDMKREQRKREREAQQQLPSAGAAASTGAALPAPDAAAAAASSLPFEPLPLFSPPYGWLPGSYVGPSAAGAAPLPPLFLAGAPLSPWLALSSPPIGGAGGLLPAAPGLGLGQQNTSFTDLVPADAPNEGGTRGGGSSNALVVQTVATRSSLFVPVADGASAASLPPPAHVRAAAAAASSAAAASPTAAAAAAAGAAAAAAAGAAAAMELSPSPLATGAHQLDGQPSGAAAAAAAAAPAAPTAALRPSGAPSALLPTLLRCPQDGRCGYSSVLLCLLTPSCRDAASSDDAVFAERWRQLGERIRDGPVELPAAFTSQPSPFATSDAALVRSLHRLLRAYLTEPSGSLHPHAAMLQSKEWQLTDGGQRTRALSRSTHAPFIALVEERAPAVQLLSDAVDYLRALVAACSTAVRYSAEFSARTSSRHGWMDSRTKAFEILTAVLGLSLTVECASTEGPFNFEVTPPQRWMQQSASGSSAEASGKQWSQEQLWRLCIRCTRGGESDAPAPESAGTHWIGVLAETLQLQSADGDTHMQPVEASEEEHMYKHSSCSPALRAPPVPSPAPEAVAAAAAAAAAAAFSVVASHDACEAKLELCKTDAARQVCEAQSEHARERSTWLEQLQAAQTAKVTAEEALVTLRQQHDDALAAFEAERVGFRDKTAAQTATAIADRQQALQSMHAGHTVLLAAMQQLQQAAPSAVAAPLQQMCDTQAALARPLGDIFVNQTTVDTWLDQYDTVTAHLALLAEESMTADYNLDSYEAINAQLSSVLRLLDTGCSWVQQILVAQLLTIRPLYDYVASHVRWYRTHAAEIGEDSWRRNNTHLARLCARYCHLCLEVWSVLHALEVPDAALRERCRLSADQLYSLAYDTREPSFSSATVSLVYDRCLFLAKHGGAGGVSQATAAAKAAAAARSYPQDASRALVASVKRVLALPSPASALPADCAQDRMLKRALKKATEAKAATVFAALLATWPWPQTVQLKTHCLLHDNDEEGAASAAWRRVETLREEVEALLERFAA